LWGGNIRGNGLWSSTPTADKLPVKLYSGYNIIAMPSATNPDWQVDGTLNGITYTNSNAISIPLKAQVGHYRLVAAGLEVHNTTPELYKGGSLTVYRAPSIETPGFIHTGVTVTVPAQGAHSFATADIRVAQPVEYVALPPSTQVKAQAFPSARTWAAEDGCYCVASMSDNENPFVINSPGVVVATLPRTFTQAANGSTQTVPAWCSFADDTWKIPSNTQDSCLQHALPFETHGVILTGLQAQATIQLTTKYYMEYIPPTSEPDMLALTRPPAEFDALALQIYTRCLADLPVGVPVGENPLGEWFTSVLDTVTSVAPKIGNFLMTVGKGIGGKIFFPPVPF
jgi:hypothetical protein